VIVVVMGDKYMGDGLSNIGVYPALHQGRLEEWGIYGHNKVAKLDHRCVIYSAREGEQVH